MERETSSEASASHWIDQAILDVDHLRQEIVSESTASRNQEGNESASPEM